MKTIIEFIGCTKRTKRGQGHYYRDLIISAGLMSKSDYYIWLANQLGLRFNDCHYSRMTSTQIVEAIKVTVNFLNSATYQRLTDYDIYHIQTTHENTKCNCSGS